MLLGEITIQGYRSIPYENPLTLQINKGITYIVGPNNIGKSNLLKFFFELKSNFNVGYNKNGEYPLNVNPGIPIVSFDNTYYQKTNFRQLKINLSSKGNYFSIEKKEEDRVIKIDSNYSNPNYVDLTDLGDLNELLTNNIYISSLRYPYNNTNITLFDIQMGSSIISQIGEWKFGSNIRHKYIFAEFEKEVGNLLGFEKFEIFSTNANNNIEVRNENGVFQLSDLGSGIAQVIIILINVFIKKPSYILIDEPETGLHPKLQRDFIQLLASKSKYGILATTHSIGLAVSTGDYVFSMYKGENQKVFLKDFDRISKDSFVERLGEMSYSSFCDIGGNHILLVEGKEDIKFYREILNKYEIGEHFIILDLGGNIRIDTFEKIAEIKRINPKSISLIIDSDKTSESDELKANIKQLLDDCKKSDILGITTDYNATENYITQSAIDKLFPNQGMLACDKYENFNQIKDRNKWGKSDNWLLVKEMTIEDFKDTELEKFILDLKSKIKLKS